MCEIKVKAVEQQLIIVNMPVIASGGVNENCVSFEFDQTWSGYGKSCVFYRDDDKDTTYDVLIVNNIAKVPFEVTQKPGKVWFGVVGSNGETAITSQVIWFNLDTGVYQPISRPATDDIYIQILSIADKIANKIPYTEYIQDAEFQLPVNTINDSKTASNSTWSSKKIDSLISGMNRLEIDNVPTQGSNNAISSGGVFDALANLGIAETDANYIRLGNVMICFGSFQIPSITVETAIGNNYCTDATISGLTGEFAKVGGFPACFTSIPSVWAFPTGSSSTMWTGRSIADAAGIKDLLIFRSEKMRTANNFTGRYIAIGRVDGARKGGAGVVSEALKYLGKLDSGNEIIDEYNAIAGTTQGSDAEWCSEFASVCANRAGIETDIFPFFASGYKGAGKFSDIGCFYKLDNGVFKQALVTNNSKNGFAYSLGTEVYTPQLGDIIWTSTNGTYPSHTGIVVSYDSDTKAIYTIEGNLGDSVGDTATKTARRMCRRVGGTTDRDRNIYAIGRVNYPAIYHYKSILGNTKGVTYE